MSKLNKHDSDELIAEKLLLAASTRWDKLSTNDMRAAALMLDAVTFEAMVDHVISYFGHSDTTDVLRDAIADMKSKSRDMIR